VAHRDGSLYPQCEEQRSSPQEERRPSQPTSVEVHETGMLPFRFRLRDTRGFRYHVAMKVMFSLMALMLSLVAGCRVSDVREMTVNVPGMNSEDDKKQVQAALEPLIGVVKEKTVFDVAGHTVKVRYDSMQIAHKNIEIAIAEAGFDANGIAAIPKPDAK